MGEKILSYLVSRGYLSRAVSEQLYNTYLESGRSVRELVAEQGTVTEEQLLEAMAFVSKLPVVRLYEQQIPAEVRQLVKPDVLRNHVVLPFQFDPDEPDTLRVAINDPMNIRGRDIVAITSKFRVKPYIATTRAHQGVIALVAAHLYYTIDDILEEAASRGEAPLIVICDELSDPHNLGAIMRSAECAGAHGVIIPKRRSVGLTATVAKASAGAVEYMKVARVTNINNAISELKEKGVWIYGTAAEGSIPMYKADLTGPAAIVIGNEGDGMSQLVRKNCDVMVHIPMKGKISSLNASAAASILLYEAVRQRLS